MYASIILPYVLISVYTIIIPNYKCIPLLRLIETVYAIFENRYPIIHNCTRQFA